MLFIHLSHTILCYRWAAIFANYTLYVIDNETWVGGFKQVSPLLYVFQTAMALEVRSSVHVLWGFFGLSKNERPILDHHAKAHNFEIRWISHEIQWIS